MCLANVVHLSCRSPQNARAFGLVDPIPRYIVEEECKVTRVRHTAQYAYTRRYYYYYITLYYIIGVCIYV